MIKGGIMEEKDLEEIREDVMETATETGLGAGEELSSQEETHYSWKDELEEPREETMDERINRKLEEMRERSGEAGDEPTMTLNGIPVTKVMKFKYNSNSKFLVESKSLKLYLNSFNMTKQGKNIKECLLICK